VIERAERKEREKKRTEKRKGKEKRKRRDRVKAGRRTTLSRCKGGMGRKELVSSEKKEVRKMDAGWRG
jgi:hypothetical protein